MMLLALFSTHSQSTPLSQVLVERMSGVYSKNFHDGVTHLVAGTVVSEKYTVAVGKEIPIMTAQWVEEVSTARD
jgi:hypothetical protein